MNTREHVCQPQAQNGSQYQDLFCPNTLSDIDFTECLENYNPQISITNPGENLILRPLQLGDFDKGYLQVLSQLTVVGNVSREQYEAKFRSMHACKDKYFVIVLEDTLTNMVVGSGTLVIEDKFIHACSSRGRIEDVVVDGQYRGRQLGKLLVDVLVLLSGQLGCYKVSLECKDRMVDFYAQFGFRQEEGQNYMCRRFCSIPLENK